MLCDPRVCKTDSRLDVIVAQSALVNECTLASKKKTVREVLSISFRLKEAGYEPGTRFILFGSNYQPKTHETTTRY